MGQISALMPLRRGLDLAHDTPGPRLAFGHAGLDVQFGGAALPLAAAHEVTAAGPGDGGAASAFALALVARLQRQRTHTWALVVQAHDCAREDGFGYGPGLYALGVDPDRVVFVSTPNAAETLRVVDEALRSGGVGVVLAELWSDERRLDLSTTKRFNLAAARSQTGCFLLTRQAASTSAAVTRWRVAARPSRADAGLLGAPAYDLHLTRNRFGKTGQWSVEWDCHDHVFRPETGALRVVRPAGDRPAAEIGERQAGGGRRQVG